MSTQWEKIISSTNLLGKIRYLYAKEWKWTKLDPYFTPLTKVCCCLLDRQGTDLGTGVDEKKAKERERLIFPGLCGKPVQPENRVCTAHKGTGHPLKEVLKAWAGKWAWQASMLQRTSQREKEGHGGPKSLVEQGCFIHICMHLYIVIQGSFR